MDERIKAYETKMSKSYDSLLKDFSTIRAGRANPHVLDKITVDYYGTPTPITAGGKHHRSGSSDSDDPALGEKDDP